MDEELMDEETCSLVSETLDAQGIATWIDTLIGTTVSTKISPCGGYGEVKRVTKCINRLLFLVTVPQEPGYAKAIATVTVETGTYRFYDEKLYKECERYD